MFVSEKPPDIETSQGRMPSISEETTKRFCEEMNLHLDSVTTRQLQDISGEKTLKPLELLNNNAFEIFRNLYEDPASRNLFERIYQGIRNGYVYGDSTACQDRITAGMASVLRLYNDESEYNLLPNMGKLDEKDAAEAEKIVFESLGSKELLSILDKVKLGNSIPETEFNLGDLLSKILRKVPVAEEYQLGFIAMYRILERFQAKLFPPSQTPTFN